MLVFIYTVVGLITACGFVTELTDKEVDELKQGCRPDYRLRFCNVHVAQCIKSDMY